MMYLSYQSRAGAGGTAPAATNPDEAPHTNDMRVLHCMIG